MPPPAPVASGPNPTPVVPLDLPALSPTPSGFAPTPTPTPAPDDVSGGLWWKKHPGLLDLDAADIAPQPGNGNGSAGVQP
jgi:hypothetical protein